MFDSLVEPYYLHEVGDENICPLLNVRYVYPDPSRSFISRHEPLLDELLSKEAVVVAVEKSWKNDDGVVVPMPTFPAKYAFPVVVAPPEMVSPVAPVPPPMVDEAKTPMPTVVDGESLEPLYSQFDTPSPVAVIPSVDVATHVTPDPFVCSTMPFVPAEDVRSKSEP